MTAAAPGNKLTVPHRILLAIVLLGCCMFAGKLLWCRWTGIPCLSSPGIDATLYHADDDGSEILSKYFSEPRNFSMTHVVYALNMEEKLLQSQINILQRQILQQRYHYYTKHLQL